MIKKKNKTSKRKTNINPRWQRNKQERSLPISRAPKPNIFPSAKKHTWKKTVIPRKKNEKKKTPRPAAQQKQKATRRPRRESSASARRLRTHAACARARSLKINTTCARSLCLSVSRRARTTPPPHPPTLHTGVRSLCTHTLGTAAAAAAAAGELVSVVLRHTRKNMYEKKMNTQEYLEQTHTQARTRGTSR